MPAYSFKERFVPMILSGSKNQTVRARRKHAPRKGQMAYLYSGMRTKHCRKLNEGPITEVRGIVINSEDGIVLYDSPLDMLQLEIAKQDPFHKSLPGCETLSDVQRDVFAWQDGFRPNKPECIFTGSFEVMIRFWSQTHQLPFSGDFIAWESDPEPADGAFCD